ncbi:metallophosphoesterase [Ruania alkalisoli]|nr:metallophosphoesterase [Ruania alkalisoli]
MSGPHRRTRTAVAALCTALPMLLLPTAASSAPVASAATDPVGDLPLLSDPFLQSPTADGVHVVWNTEFEGSNHVVLLGPQVATLTAEQAQQAAAGATFTGVRVIHAESLKYSRLAEDSSSRIPDAVRPTEEEGIVHRDVWRHEATIDGLATGEVVPYRVVSTDAGDAAVSGTFSLRPSPAADDDLRILLTSDHQAMANTAANLQLAAETIGDIDGVFLAGDLVNHPDRASEWFDDSRGSAFLAVLQGNGNRLDNHGITAYHGGEIIQNAPLFPAVGNHEVHGRVAGAASIGAAYGSPVPIAVAEAEYERVAAEVNPTDDPQTRAQWIEDNSFSTTSYEEMFTLPDDSPGGETYYATTFGGVRLVSLYSTRIWRSPTAVADPEERTSSSRYQEAASSLDEPLEQGYGEHIFESLAVGSEQYEWLEEELASDEFQDAAYRIVMLHESPQGLGDNVMPQFADPVRIEETNDSGEVIGVRYEYPPEGNILRHDLQPLLEGAEVDLVHNGHSHLWNRFESENGVNYLETSNTGNTYGAYHELSGRSRPLPGLPWDDENYLAQGNPGGLEPIVPNVEPFTAEDGTPLPFVQSNDLAVFAMLDTGAGEVVSYAFDVRTPEIDPWVIDRFELGRSVGEEPGGEEPGGEEPGGEEPGGEEPGGEEPGGEEPGGEEPGGEEPGDDGEPATVTLSTSSVVAGDALEVNGSGFPPGEEVRIELHSHTIELATVEADGSGTVTAQVTIPATAVGSHRIVLISESGVRASAALTVTAAAGGGDLAETGSDTPVWMVAGSAALLFGGMTMFLVARQRRTIPES